MMYGLKKFLFLFVFCLFPSLAIAQNNAPDPKQALAAWTKAVETGTVDQIVALYDKDATMLSAFALDPLTSHDQLRGYFSKVVKEPNRKVDVTKQDVRVFGDVAMNTGLYKFYFEQDGEPLELPARFTFVYKLKDGQWKIISHHSSRVPGAKAQ
ncbi:MAG: SgcJ/EcaC family oxidoreductase [Rickettsiales bacterium]|nr:SgcJ/EcaC family oxidoreductase [Rickettsiales bacterium]